MAFLLAIVAGQVAPPVFAETPAVCLEVTEDLAPDELLPVRRIGQVTPRVVTRSNMLPEGLLEAVSQFPRSQVVLRLPLLRAHLEQLEHRPGVGVLLDVGSSPLDAAAVSEIQRLGPRTISVRLNALDSERAQGLAKLGPIGVEIDARGRELEGEELGRLLRLFRARRVVHIDAAVSVAQLLGLTVLRPVALVVHLGADGKLEAAVKRALVELGCPVTLRFERVPASDLVGRDLSGLRASIELAPANDNELSPAALQLLRVLSPGGEGPR